MGRRKLREGLLETPPEETDESRRNTWAGGVLSVNVLEGQEDDTTSVYDYYDSAYSNGYEEGYGTSGWEDPYADYQDETEPMAYGDYDSYETAEESASAEQPEAGGEYDEQTVYASEDDGQEYSQDEYYTEEAAEEAGEYGTGEYEADEYETAQESAPGEEEEYTSDAPAEPEAAQMLSGVDLWSGVKIWTKLWPRRRRCLNRGSRKTVTVWTTAGGTDMRTHTASRSNTVMARTVKFIIIRIRKDTKAAVTTVKGSRESTDMLLPGITLTIRMKTATKYIMTRMRHTMKTVTRQLREGITIRMKTAIRSITTRTPRQWMKTATR